MKLAELIAEHRPALAITSIDGKRLHLLIVNNSGDVLLQSIGHPQKVWLIANADVIALDTSDPNCLEKARGACPA